MKFNEMLIMVGPAGVPCAHSVCCPESGRALNNHWLKSSKGVLVARGAEYTVDYDVGTLDQYQRKTLIPPQLMTVEYGEIKQLDITDAIINENWEVVGIDEVSKRVSG